MEIYYKSKFFDIQLYLLRLVKAVNTGGSGKFKLRSVVKRYPWPSVKPYNLSEVRTCRFESGVVIGTIVDLGRVTGNW